MIVPSSSRPAVVSLPRVGQEWIVDVGGADPVRLRARPPLEALVASLIETLALRVVGPALWHVFPGEAGVTALVLLAESHLALHTFPEYGTMSLNLYCCRARPSPAWSDLLRAAVGATTVQVRTLARGGDGSAGE